MLVALGFWQTAGAAFVGGLGLALAVGIGRLLRHAMWAHGTGVGRYVSEMDHEVDALAGELASKMRDDRD